MRAKLKNIIFDRLDLRMKLKTNKIFIKKLRPKMRNQIKGQGLQLKY
jgi:hypothetical protein